MKTIRKGDPVEFTLKNPYPGTYSGEGALFGIATEDERPNRTVEVEMADGSKQVVIHIHAYAWSGWLPDDLEKIAAKYAPADELDYESLADQAYFDDGGNND